MSTKTISITDEAYMILKSFKDEGESFTEVIKKLAGKRSYTDIIGFLSKDEAEEMEEQIKDIRSESSSRLDRIVKEMAD